MGRGTGVEYGRRKELSCLPKSTTVVVLVGPSIAREGGSVGGVWDRSRDPDGTGPSRWDSPKLGLETRNWSPVPDKDLGRRINDQIPYSTVNTGNSLSMSFPYHSLFPSTR